MPTPAFSLQDSFAPHSAEQANQSLYATLLSLRNEHDVNRLGQALTRAYAAALINKKTSHPDGQNRMALQRSQCLLQELMQGFIRLAELKRHDSGLFSSSRPRLEAFGMALESAWQLACLHARSRSPLPEGFWLSCHQLFTQLQALGWTKRSLKNGNSPSVLYRQIMLLSISASNRLEAHKLPILFKLIEEEARFLDLVQLDQALNSQGAFVFQPQRDEAPRFTQTLAGETQQVWWAIETQAILKQLSHRLQKLLEHNRHHEIQLIGRLLQEWSTPPRRQHFRIRRNNGEKIQLISLWPRCWDLAAGLTDATSPEPAQFTICNISRSGLLLQGDSSEQPLQAGEIIMVRRGGQQWQLGLVRWLSLRGDDLSSECGIELVGRSPEAVHIAPITSLGADTLTPALSLPPDHRRGHSGMLILAGSKQYQPMRMFTVHDSRGICTVRATRLVMQTAYYQFIETRLEEVAAKTPPVNDEESKHEAMVP